MKNWFIIFVCCVAAGFANAQEPTWEWAVKHGGTSNDFGTEICTDAAGNSYMIGYFSGTITVGGLQLVSLGSSDVCVIKSNSLGEVEWAVKAGGANGDAGWDIALGPEGSVYITGYFWGGAYFGSTMLTSVGQFDIFVAKLDNYGNWQWARRAGGAVYDHGYGIATDADGNCFVTGYYTGSATFGTVNLIDSPIYGEEFVAKLDSAGNWLWASTSTCAEASSGQAISTDGAGNAYVTGNYNSDITFGSTSLSCNGVSDPFVAKISPGGTWLWAVRGDGDGNEWANSIATNSEGYSVITGGFISDYLVFGDTTLPGEGFEAEIFVAALDAQGIFQWASYAGALTYTDEGRDVALDAYGNAFITGYFQSYTGTPAHFGTTSLVSYGGKDTFIAKVNNTGVFQWAVHAGSASMSGDSGMGIDVTTGGMLVVTGNFSTTATFGPFSLVASGTDIYIVRLDDAVFAPGEVNLLSPEDGAMNLPISGFDLVWEPDPLGAAPDSYVVYLASDPSQIYAQLSWPTLETSLDPVADQGFVFDYDQTWYWTVEAINPGGSSFVDPPHSFTTQSEDTVVSFPASWDFEGPAFPPEGWTTVDLDGGGTFWALLTDTNHTPGGSQSAGHSYSSEAPEGQTGWLITPPVAVPPGQYMTLSFWNLNWFEGYYGYNGLLVNTTNDPNDPGWIELWSPERVWSEWHQHFVDISAYGGQTVYFGFKYAGFDGHIWVVDDVSIYQVLPVTSFPAVWDFEDAFFPPEGWTHDDLDGTPTSWQATADMNHTPDGGQAATHPYSTLWPEFPGQNGWLVTPPVEVPLGLNMVLNFWYYNIYSGANQYCALKVNTVNDPLDPNWVELWRPAMVYEEWREQAVNITQFGGQTVYFAFHYLGNDADNWVVDDITIYQPTGDDTLSPVISYLPPLNTPRYDLDRVVTATVTDDPNFNSGVGGVILYYKHWGADTFTPLAMYPDSGDTYYAIIPASGYYDEIDYYFEAWDTQNNYANTPIYSWYYVENPCWLSYDWGGTGHQSFAEEFGAAVMYENPFYGQDFPLQVLQTGCGSNIASSAILHVYAYENGILTDLMPPLPVNLNEGDWISYHDLSALEVMVETQYFVVAYEDIPAYTGIWHERRLDYGASFRIDDGVLSEMLLPGSWVLPAQITNGGLAAPVITISPVDWYWSINWEPVPGAAGYKFYGSSDPSAPDPWTLLQMTQDNWVFYQEPEPMQFFKVTAISEWPLKSGTASPRQLTYRPLGENHVLPASARKEMRLEGNRVQVQKGKRG